MGVVFNFAMLMMCLLNDYLSISKGERLLLLVRRGPVQTGSDGDASVYRSTEV